PETSARRSRSGGLRAGVIARNCGSMRSARHVSHVHSTEPSAVNLLASLLRDTVREWRADNAIRLGAALADYALFSLAAVLIIAIAITGLVFEQERAHAQIVEQIGGLIGRDVAEAISGMIQHSTTAGSTILAAALSAGLMLLGASGAFVELQQ